ncbi:MAG TPA: ATP-binding protein, partial [Adhaeribacter sp.]|nr:ATP-binding protein [Adhaeribacter sp.]
NGEEIDIDISLAPIQVGKEQMAIAIIRDITVVKNLERSLLKKNEELSLTNTQLERLGYIIAHDLKSPLLNVHALVSMLNRELGPDASPAVTGITKDMDQILLSMMDLITGVTEYSRVSFQDDSEAEVDLNEIAEDIRKLVHFPANFSFVVKGSLPKVKGNRTKVLQVFLNLVNNAMKYNDKPDGRIEIFAYPKDDMCLINVADNGPGISPELLGGVFDLFRKGLVEKEGSTGIGLAVVKKIIEDNGGQIWVENSELGGANFVFTWPARKEKPDTTFSLPL